MNRPFVPMFRDLFDTPIWKDVNCWRVYCYLCYRAAHKEVSLTAHTGRGSTVVKLQKGQVLFGRISAARDCGMTESAVRSAISKLERLGAITQKPTSHYSILTICDTMVYEYQSPINNQATASQPPANYHKQDIIDIKDNREEESDTGDSDESPTPSKVSVRVTEEQVEKIIGAYPKPDQAPLTVSNIRKAIKHIAKNKDKLFMTFNNIPEWVHADDAKAPARFLYWRTTEYAEYVAERNLEEQYIFKASNFFSSKFLHYLTPKWSNKG